MNVFKVFGELTYGSYARDRDEMPAITPESWKHVYGPDVDAMEARYQAEKTKEAA